MKPKKNHVFCRACNRPKMLFESQAKADNFIKFNRDEIKSSNGKAPERSYFCAFCGGWHVTSCKSAEIGSHIDNRDQSVIKKLDSRRNGKEELRKIAEDIGNLIGKKKHLMYFHELDFFEETLCACRNLLETMRKYSDYLPKYFEAKGKIDKFEKDLNAIRLAAAMTQEERNHVLGIEYPTKEEAVLQEKIHGIQLIENFNDAKDGIEKKIDNGEYEKANEMIAAFKNKECKIERDSPFNGVRGELARRMNILVKKINVCIDRERRLERKKRLEEEKNREEIVQDKERMAKVSEENRKAMLEILQRIEAVKAALRNKEAGNCEDEIEVIYYLLEQLPIKDENYMILKAHTDLMTAEIKKMTRGAAA